MYAVIKFEFYIRVNSLFSSFMFYLCIQKYNFNDNFTRVKHKLLNSNENINFCLENIIMHFILLLLLKLSPFIHFMKRFLILLMIERLLFRSCIFIWNARRILLFILFQFFMISLSWCDKIKAKKYVNKNGVFIL